MAALVGRQFVTVALALAVGGCTSSNGDPRSANPADSRTFAGSAARIGAEGGKVASADQHIEVAFAAGEVTTGSEATLFPFDAEAGPPPDHAIPLLPPVHVNVEDPDATGTVTFTYPYPIDSQDYGRVGISARSDDSTAWEPLPTEVTSDSTSTTITARTPHFSWFVPSWASVTSTVSSGIAVASDKTTAASDALADSAKSAWDWTGQQWKNIPTVPAVLDDAAGLLGEGVAQAELLVGINTQPPKCSPKSPDLSFISLNRNGGHTTWPALKACAEGRGDDGSYLVKVRNTYPYPLELNLPDAGVTQVNLGAADLSAEEWIAELAMRLARGTQGRAVISAGDQISLRVVPGPNGVGDITATPAWSQVTMSAVLTALTFATTGESKAAVQATRAEVEEATVAAEAAIAAGEMDRGLAYATFSEVAKAERANLKARAARGTDGALQALTVLDAAECMIKQDKSTIDLAQAAWEQTDEASTVALDSFTEAIKACVATALDVASVLAQGRSKYAQLKADIGLAAGVAQDAVSASTAINLQALQVLSRGRLDFTRHLLRITYSGAGGDDIEPPSDPHSTQANADAPPENPVYAIIKSADAATDTVHYDALQWLTGQAAVEECLNEGESAEAAQYCVDYTYRNDNPELRTAVFAPDATFRILKQRTAPESVSRAEFFASLHETAANHGEPALGTDLGHYWLLHYNGTQYDSVSEVFVP